MGYRIVSLSQTITLPGATTTGTTAPYTAGDLVANSSVAASVTPLSWPVGANFKLNSVQITSNSTVNTNCKFKAQLYGSSPTASNGDNGVWLTTASNYIDAIPVDCSLNAFSSGVSGIGFYTPTSLGSSVTCQLQIPYTTFFSLLTANAGWQASSTTTVTVTMNGEVSW